MNTESRSILRTMTLLAVFSLGTVFILHFPLAGAVAGGSIPLRVAKGTGLILFAEKYCTSRYHWREIARLNKLSPPYLLKENQELLVPEELLKTEKLAARIENVHGGVFFQKFDKTTIPVKNGDSLLPGRTLVTDDAGFAYIIFPDHRFTRLANNSSFRLQYLVRMIDGGIHAEGFLEKGKVVHAVRNHLKANESFRTRTPTAITGVRGTEFRVKVNSPNESTVETLSGLVAVESGGNRLGVAAGYGLRLQQDGALAPPSPLPPIPAQPPLLSLYKKLPIVVQTPVMTDISDIQLQISNDSEGNDVILEKMGQPGAALTLLALPDGQYYGTLTAFDTKGFESPASGPVLFQLRTSPGPPLLSAPYQGRRVFDTARKVAWTKSDTAEKYHLQVARDAAFTDLHTDTVQTEAVYQLEDLAPGKYFVRVQAIAVDGFTSLYSLTDSWEVSRQPELGAMSSASNGTNDLTLSWATMGSGITYDLQIASTTAFTSPLVSAEGLQKSSYTLNHRPEPGTYRIRIRGVLDDGQKSPWSPPQSFTIEPPPFGWLDGALLAVFLGIVLL